MTRGGRSEQRDARGWQGGSTHVKFKAEGGRWVLGHTIGDVRDGCISVLTDNRKAIWRVPVGSLTNLSDR